MARIGIQPDNAGMSRELPDGEGNPVAPCGAQAPVGTQSHLRPVATRTWRCSSSGRFVRRAQLDEAALQTRAGKRVMGGVMKSGWFSR